MPAPRKYPEELRERGVRLALESDRPIAQVAKDLGIQRESLRRWVRQAEADQGQTGGPADQREVKELRWAKRDPQGRLGFFRDRARPATAEVSAFIEERRCNFGRVSTFNLYRVASICRPPKSHEPVFVRLGMVHRPSVFGTTTAASDCWTCGPRPHSGGCECVGGWRNAASRERQRPLWPTSGTASTRFQSHLGGTSGERR